MVDTALESIRLLPKQIKDTWEKAHKLELPKEYKDVDMIAISGMGGSIYNYYMLASLFKAEFKKPLLRVNNYGLPICLSNKSLFVASSYSGGTEEPVYNLKQAYKKGIKCLVISAGGEVIEYAKKNKIPFYQFTQTFNPSLQPRMGQGYMLFSPIALFHKLSFFNQSIDISFLEQVEKIIPEIMQSAEVMAKSLLNQELFFIAADHLSANAHILRNQTNETAKLFADYNLIPELNHHQMEGLKHPETKNRTFVFLESDLYFPRNIQRVELTKEVIVKNNFPVVSYQPKTKTKLAQFVETLIWGGYLTYYLGRDYGEDPNKVPWVDYFKQKLGKMDKS